MGTCGYGGECSPDYMSLYVDNPCDLETWCYSNGNMCYVIADGAGGPGDGCTLVVADGVYHCFGTLDDDLRCACG
jgi:hypothetical protein